MALIFLFVFKEGKQKLILLFLLALGILYLGIYISSHQTQNLIEAYIVIVRDIKSEVKISFIHTSNGLIIWFVTYQLATLYLGSCLGGLLEEPLFLQPKVLFTVFGSIIILKCFWVIEMLFGEAFGRYFFKKHLDFKFL